MIDLSRNGNQNPVQPMLVSARDAAKLLAISERTLWSLTAAGEIPVVRIGRSVRYDPRDLQTWIERSKQRLPVRAPDVLDQQVLDQHVQAPLDRQTEPEPPTPGAAASIESDS
jgi:excisionase family DNA binding protein